MIKTNIKMRATLKQLIEIGKIIPICKSFTNAKYIFIYKDGRTTWSNKEYEFNRKEYMQEIDPELFIKTNGSCIENKDECEIDNSIDINQKPIQYQIGIDTFERAKANLTKDKLIACIKFNIDKYNWRKKGQDVEDFKKIIDYANFAIEVLKGEK